MLDECYHHFQTLLSDARGNWDQILTEEDAKIQLINRILTSVLGWKPGDFKAERKHSSGFSDYIICQPNSPAFVLEAKRLGQIEVSTKEDHTHKAFKISGPALKGCLDAIEQARNYASDEGIGLYVVTDGNAWILGKTHIEGRRWKEAEALVFPSLNAISENFSNFYDLLHKEQIKKRIYVRVFDEVHHSRGAYDRKQFSAFSESDITLERKTPLAFDLDRVFDVYFSRMRGEDDPDLLVNCFVESRESRIADFSLEKMTAKILGNINPDFHNLDTHLATLVTSAVEVDEGQTVFIIGPTGAGKTTFLDRFFRKTLPSRVREQCALASVNMRDSVGDEANAVSWFVERLIAEFEREIFPEGYPKWENLLGLYFGEYKRRAEGELKELYESNISEFKIRFGEIMAEHVRSDREGYLKRIIKDIVVNRKRLPVIIIDNIDELPFEIQKNVFQASQALKRHVKHMLILFPITDKSAWTFSKSDIFGIYASKSFFLPTPSPREVFRKRIDYLRQKASDHDREETIPQYFLSRGIRVKIKDLHAFSRVLEEVFVDNEYASKTIGELSNYNIRRMLSLSRRVMTSAVFDVDELIKGVVSGGALSPAPKRFMNALMRGDYKFFKDGDMSEIVSIFKTSGKIFYSPLLTVRILSLLNSASATGRNVEDRHLSHESIFSFFDYFGVSESAVNTVLSDLLSQRLIESYDTSSNSGHLGTVYSISFSGSCHLRLALENWVFFEQMACTTPMNDSEAALEIRSDYLSDGGISNRLKKVRDRFARYLLSEDSKNFAVIPDFATYKSQLVITERIQRMMNTTNTEQQEIVEEPIECTGSVDWFDPERGFGFIKVPGNPQGVYINEAVLHHSGIDTISTGSEIRFSATRTPKGLSVSSVLAVTAGNQVVTRSTVQIARIFPDRKYGFAKLEDTESVAFFHFSVIPRELMKHLAEGASMVADVYHDEEQDVFQVRTVLSFQ